MFLDNGEQRSSASIVPAFQEHDRIESSLVGFQSLRRMHTCVTDGGRGEVCGGMMADVCEFNLFTGSPNRVDGSALIGVTANGCDIKDWSWEIVWGQGRERLCHMESG